MIVVGERTKSTLAWFATILVLLFSVPFLMGQEGCEEPSPGPPPPPGQELESISNEYLKVTLLSNGLRILDASGKVLMETAANPDGSWIGYTRYPDQKCTREWGVYWTIDEGNPDPWIWTKKVIRHSAGDRDMEVILGDDAGKEQVKLNFSFESDKRLRGSIQVLEDSAGINRVKMLYKLYTDERFFGLGERQEGVEHHGERIRCWCNEGFVGSFNPNLDHLNWPVPFYLSNRGYGFLIDDTHVSEFDLGKNDAQRLIITNWNQSFNWYLFYGPEPLSVIEEYTAKTGRATMMPKPWVFGVWTDSDGGSKRAREVIQKLRDNDIASSTIWAEDWANIFSGPWGINTSRYPDYQQVTDEIHALGFKFLSYWNPFVNTGDPLYNEGKSKGYFIKNSSGEPYTYNFVILYTVTNPDLTRPETREWWKNRVFPINSDYGVDGWMADFGEHTPHDAFFYDGRDGWAIHNEYPVLWQKLNREFWEEKRPDGDFVFFSRSGYTGSQKYSPVMWTGDQEINWGELDGLPCVVPAALGIGISGFPVTATDIAGYHGIDVPLDRQQLWFRWCELGAMLPVMRTHHGFSSTWLFDQNQETLMHYKKYANLHVGLFPYFYSLMQEAMQKGWPIVRHLFLHYPDDPNVLSIEDEFLVGDRMLVAPVVTENATSREVYLPEGSWIDFWSGTRYTGGARYTVSAPVDVIPIFLKEGTALPFLDAPVDTLVEEDDPELVGLSDAQGSMTITVFGAGDSTYTLDDGTVVTCTGSGVAGEGVEVVATTGTSSAPPVGQRSFGASGPSVSLAGSVVEAEVRNAAGQVVARCHVEGPARNYTLRFVCR